MHSSFHFVLMLAITFFFEKEENSTIFFALKSLLISQRTYRDEENIINISWQKQEGKITRYLSVQEMTTFW